jgi:hypothetical protein
MSPQAYYYGAQVHAVRVLVGPGDDDTIFQLPASQLGLSGGCNVGMLGTDTMLEACAKAVSSPICIVAKDDIRIVQVLRDLFCSHADMSSNSNSNNNANSNIGMTSKRESWCGQHWVDPDPDA